MPAPSSPACGGCPAVAWTPFTRLQALPSATPWPPAPSPCKQNTRTQHTSAHQKGSGSSHPSKHVKWASPQGWEGARRATAPSAPPPDALLILRCLCLLYRMHRRKHGCLCPHTSAFLHASALPLGATPAPLCLTCTMHAVHARARMHVHNTRTCPAHGHAMRPPSICIRTPLASALLPRSLQSHTRWVPHRGPPWAHLAA